MKPFKSGCSGDGCILKTKCLRFQLKHQLDQTFEIPPFMIKKGNFNCQFFIDSKMLEELSKIKLN